MDINNSHNQSYWFVLREDQSNVIFSSNNFPINSPQITGQETKYVVDNGQYIQLNESDVPVVSHEQSTETDRKEIIKQCKEENSFWDRNKIKLLLALCLENKCKNLYERRSYEVWNEIATIVGASPEECNKKYKNLRRIYIRLLKKKLEGKDIKWVHFNICEEVFKDCKSLPLSILEPWDDRRIRTLVQLYLDNLSRFQDPDCLNKDIWKDIAVCLGTSEYNCYHKFRNLKRSYFKLLKKNRESEKQIKWPYQHLFDKIYFDYNPDSNPWNRNTIQQLLDAYAQIAHKFKNPKFMKKELWKEISSIVGESPSSCDRKFRNLKQTYIKIKMKVQSNKISWRYFKDFEMIYNNETHSTSKSVQHLNRFQEEDYIKRLLMFYIDNKEKFRDPLIKKKVLWRMISPKLGLSPEGCNKKFRNLKQTYIRLLEKKRQTGKCNKWPYYTYFEQIFDDDEIRIFNKTNEDVRLSEIQRVVKEVQDRRDNVEKFDTLMRAVEESNNIQRERNKILQALLNRR